jgi:hypothetical protein
MTVQEIIDKLSSLPGDLDINFPNHDDYEVEEMIDELIENILDGADVKFSFTATS